MKVWTRITAAIAIVVAVSFGAYALVELRASQQEAISALRTEARQLALALRENLEATGSAQSGERLRKELSTGNIALTVKLVRAANDWNVELFSAADRERSDLPAPQLERLQTIFEARPLELLREEKGKLVYTLPIRVAADLDPDGYRIVGAIEVAHSLSAVDKAWRNALWRVIPIFVVLLLLTILALTIFTRRLVTRPIEKLIAGIDDVAHGDLSRVLLSEREDEIGALAVRFNEMTHSLRESRAETKRQNEAKTNLEEQLSQNEKLATIGQLAAEIAHEVGTPLNVIAGRARGMGKKAQDPEAVVKNSRIIAEQTDRITRIIQRLLDFARRKVGTVERESVNLNQVALTTMDFLGSKFSAAKVRSSLDREEGIPKVLGHPDQLQQVLINLILNAVDATGSGGTVRVETARVTRQRPGLEMAPENSYVVVTVSDDGPGIPKEDIDKIFEPFYTSKVASGGTGLGLAVSHGIIKDHDGWIEVSDDADGVGTTFSVYLPTFDSSRQSASLPAIKEAAP